LYWELSNLTNRGKAREHIKVATVGRKSWWQRCGGLVVAAARKSWRLGAVGGLL